MKVVINSAFGGFCLPKGFVEQYDLESHWDFDGNTRTSAELISYIEEHGPEDTDLEVVEVPDNVTDWEIHEYDGMESIICVIDGKIVWL